MTPASLNGPILDFHARLTPGPRATAALLSTMDKAGIARAAVAAGGVVDLDRLSRQIVHGGRSGAPAPNLNLARAAEGTAGRLVPFYLADPWRDPAEYREQATRFRGLEISPAVHGVGFDDAGTHALVDIAARCGHPVYTVCLGRPGTRTGDLIALARRYPQTPFVFGHSGFIAVDTHSLNQIAATPNIVVETSGCFAAVVRTALDRLGPHRVLFGTEYPLQHPRVELAKFETLALADDVWRQIAWFNARRLLREDSP